jgi:hypothetical protein
MGATSYNNRSFAFADLELAFVKMPLLLAKM